MGNSGLQFAYIRFNVTLHRAVMDWRSVSHRLVKIAWPGLASLWFEAFNRRHHHDHYGYYYYYHLNMRI